METKITRFHGDLLRITAFEGGLQGLAVFGLPGNAHKDDPRRASLTAFELQADISRLGLNVSIGAATGDAFCGAIGTDRRAEYTVLGEAVNRAARLAAIAAGRTLADGSTAQRVLKLHQLSRSLVDAGSGNSRTDFGLCRGASEAR